MATTGGAMWNGDKSQLPVGVLVTASLVFAFIVVVSAANREQPLDQIPNQAGDASGSARDDSVLKVRYQSAWKHVNAADVIKQESITNRALDFVATINDKPVERYEAEVSLGVDGQQFVHVVPRGKIRAFGSDRLLVFSKDGEMIDAIEGM